MSDFLTRLAQRQLGQIATIEPRLPGLHAPLAGDLFVDPGAGFEHQSIAATEARIVSSAPRTSARAAAKPAVTLTDFSTIMAPPRHKPLSGEKRLGVDQPSQIETKIDNQEIPRIDPGTQLPAAVSPRLGAPLSLEHRSIDLPSGARPTQPAHESSPLLKRGFVAEENTAWAARPLFPVLPPLVERKASDEISAPQSMHGLLEVAGMSRRTNPRQAIDAAETPVQVTIGRIEVTAVTAAAPAKQVPMARKQGMTLDTYLARRQRGER